jgi:hypothetical protein
MHRIAPRGFAAALAITLAFSGRGRAEEGGKKSDQIWHEFEACKQTAGTDAHALDACRDKYLDAYGFAQTEEELGITPTYERRFDITHLEKAKGKPDKKIVHTVWGIEGKKPWFVKSRLAIDADGAPNAYHPGFTCDPKKPKLFKSKAHPEYGCVPDHESYAGLDWLQNAGDPKGFYGITYDAKKKQLCIQGPNDPSPGFYVSSTALLDKAKGNCDPGKYVDSNTIPYLSLPRELYEKKMVALGDFAYAYNLKNKKGIAAIAGDVGPRGKVGEASIAVAKALGGTGNVKHGGGIDAENIVYLVFPTSGNGKARPAAEIEREGARLLKEWGGIEQVEGALQPK